MPETLTLPNDRELARPMRFNLQQLKEAVALEVESRRIIRAFVRAQLEEGKDYGSIPVRGKNGLVTQSKPVLFKSGMEKIFSLFNVVSTLERDTETIEMIGKPGVIAYKCLLSRGGNIIGEGRGACDIAEKGRINDTIKIAEKRARMDACLNLGFSEYFTQDLEDYDTPEEAPESLKSAEVEDSRDGWKNGEVRDMVVTVRSKEMKSSQAGTSYALLHTDKGVIKAWKNTYPNMEAGCSYRIMVEATFWNNTLSLAVSRLLGEITKS